MDKQYKITMPEARPMTEEPTGRYRYIYANGKTSPALQEEAHSGIGRNAIGWVPTGAIVEEIITPGWCEYKENGHRFVYWRNSRGKLSASAASTTPSRQSRRQEFIRQLTFEPQEADNA
jgi:hypothetical protein